MGEGEGRRECSKKGGREELGEGQQSIRKDEVKEKRERQKEREKREGKRSRGGGD